MATVVFIAPHQDDETLSMGPAIRAHVEAGHDVHTLLCTNGINSAARGQTGLSRTQFTAARDDEYRRACAALGVPARNVRISRHSVADGALTEAAADDTVRAILDLLPGAWIKTYSPATWTGRHTDHSNLGAAVMGAYRDGAVTNLRFYVEPWQLDTVRAERPELRLMPEKAASAGAVRAALDAYTVVDRPTGRYGIGGISVPDAFARVRADMTSYCHVPGR